MKNPKLLLMVLLLFQVIVSKGQSTVDKDLEVYLNSLKKKKVNSWVVVEQGCVGCEVKRNGFAITDSKSYYVISKYNQQYQLHKIDGFGKYSTVIIDTTSVFSLVEESLTSFKEKDEYLNRTASESKTLKFLPPRPVHYSYTSLTVNLPHLKSDLKIINDEFDANGFMISNKEWFMPINQVVSYVLNVVPLTIK